jgi:hypothetical protein
VLSPTCAAARALWPMLRMLVAIYLCTGGFKGKAYHYA